jgi:hypothetical protein
MAHLRDSGTMARPRAPRAPQRGRDEHKPVDSAGRGARERPLEELVLELDGIALPRRVAAATRMMADVADALGGELPGMTLVASNRNMQVALRARDGPSAHAVNTVAHVLENPLEAIQAAPELRTVARVIADGMRSFAPLGGRFRKRGTRKPLVLLDQAFIRVMDAASRPPIEERRWVQGTAEVYSPVLRVGRLREGAPPQVRLFLAGELRDVNVDPEKADDFFNAAKRGTTQRIRIEARWFAGEEGALVLDTRAGAVRALEAHDWSPITGVISPQTIDSMLDDLRDDE